MQNSRYSCHSAIKFEFSRQIFEKYLNTKFNENPSSGRRFVQCRRTDGHYEGSSRFLQYCGRA